jgi:hypothetical protein
LKSSIDAKANTVDQNMENLKDALAKVDTKLTELKRSQLLAAGIQNCSYNSFKYYDKDNSQKTSEDLVRPILFFFQRGMGSWLPNAALGQVHYESEDKKRKSQQDFHDSLVVQIHALTGEKPCIERSKNKDGAKYAIYQY